MDIYRVVVIFLNTVDGLMSTHLSGKRIYVETKEGKYINFRPNSFKKKLQDVAGRKEDINKLLDVFRKLGWLVVNDTERFTNIQWINRKSVRVITINRAIYETLKELVHQKG